MKNLEPNSTLTRALESAASSTGTEPDSAADFAGRHIGPSADDVAAMLKVVGAPTLDALMDETLPPSIRLNRALEIGPALSEPDTLRLLRSFADENQRMVSLIGMGYYDTHVPPVILRNVLENPAWYTAYTPYQPEISQGRLEALLNFQTLVRDLTALDVANASLLDEATAAAEAMALARRVAASPSKRFLVDSHVHPQTLSVLRTRAEPLGWEIHVTDPGVLTGEHADPADSSCFGALFQYPDTHGHLPDLTHAVRAVRSQGGIVAVAADLLSLTLLSPPGEWGADIAIGSAQRFGVPLGFGGPHAAYMAVRAAHQRHLPGRLVGVSVDARGRPAYRLALQTREQHIRRDKATSNICTAQALLAIAASMYAIYHGPEGLRRIAQNVHHRTAVLATGLRKLGRRLLNQTFFDTLTVDSSGDHAAILNRAAHEKLNFRVLTAATGLGTASGEPPYALGMSLDETTTDDTVEAIWRCFGGDLRFAEVDSSSMPSLPGIPAQLRRTTAFLTHPVFHSHRSETELLRYLRRLSDRDLALDRTMIPLGSCTMKLNATAEMIPMTWPEFGGLHPFAPAEQTRGYRRLFTALELALCEITGYDAFSLQPNSGAQGEYAGLLAIRAYHRSRSAPERNVCLIPASAHGTNPASAAMAGMQVVVVRCDEHGNVDLGDLARLCERYTGTLAAIMVTYPSTHGVFEEGIRTLCELVHAAGGQVYVDGANLNAQVGLARPADYGADVSHLNLHKTFCIPHGGGGPGMGPIGVKRHLAPFLPRHPLESPRFAHEPGPVSAAPYGSASILPIAYAYIRLLGSSGLTQASKIAVLSANYIAARLAPHFPVLYRNGSGRVAHECILDPRALKDTCGVTVDDIAKRLIDYGFHAPTMSFPVPGTLMIEPTESESKRELDRFCDAMASIRAEIRDIEQGRHAVEDSPLRRAPHTAVDLAEEAWERPYSRLAGALPAGNPADKYWPPVGRIDNVYGDRNLACSCPPVEADEAGR
ncbi:MAG TPA: aminomethyl-transferring glycine dehydrogenase [Steroidobacteraceae bacterium]|jgi:glycine dehydrogenase|nr:aminomethyl-transferring glycine dehydrogenase [Steroidobacteraceae bacterium]